VTVKHGAYSARHIFERADEFRRWFLDVDPPWLVESDSATIERYCLSMARSRMLSTYVMDLASQQGVQAVPKTLWSQLDREMGRAGRLCDELGLSPVSNAERIRRAAEVDDLGQLVALVLRQRVESATLADDQSKFLRRRIGERLDEWTARLQAGGPPVMEPS
jgi:hypothetical protein